MSEDCLFCRIASGEAEAEIVDEDDRWVAFRDVNPQAPTHVLVIPREHVENLNDVEPGGEELLGELLMAVRRVAESEGLDEGYRVVANNERQAGQSVFHLHFHVLGGRAMGWPPG